ncbi:SorU family sulfite dehydrogenase c-type cytochrome subunit [Schauerella aestuarii]|uniref:SorU family sulfite dehydrogenase c-type cytochrome subunit n=1 Tax=Schauerella aestuarii TaxID=2511204 RepID=UPI0038B284FC
MFNLIGWRGRGPKKRLKTHAGYAAALALSLSSSSSMAEPPTTAMMDAGRQLFHKAAPACALCHTLADAQSTGAIGPVLDEIKPDATRVETAIRNGIGQMPAYTNLSEQDIKTLSSYVAKAAAGE